MPCLWFLWSAERPGLASLHMADICGKHRSLNRAPGLCTTHGAAASECMASCDSVHPVPECPTNTPWGSVPDRLRIPNFGQALSNKASVPRVPRGVGSPMANAGACVSNAVKRPGLQSLVTSFEGPTEASPLHSESSARLRSEEAR